MGERRTDERIQQTGTGIGVQRRGLLAGAAALVVGLVAKQTSQPVAANSDGQSLTIGQPNTEVGATVLSWAGDTITSGSAFGVGDTGGPPAQPYSAMVSGVSTFSKAGTGVYGEAGDVGIKGYSAGNIGVYGTSIYGNGVVGRSTQDNGILGGSTLGNGILGTSTHGYGVVGSTDAQNSGYAGVYGIGNSTVTYGVVGVSAGNGVYGQSSSAAGVRGQSDAGFGVQGQSSTSHGVVGLSGTGAGASGVVAVGQSPGTVGFQGVAQGGAIYAGYFYGDVSIQKRVSDGQGGNLGVAGAKFAVVKGKDGKHRGMYAMESPLCWFEDFGTAKLVNGAATVTLDPLFAQHIHTDDYHVFLTAEADSKGVYVAEKTVSGFVAREQQGGTSSVAFSWRVVGKRNDIKNERLPVWDTVQGAGGVVKVPETPPQAAPPARPAPPTAASPATAPPPAALPPQGSGVQPVPPPRP